MVPSNNRRTLGHSYNNSKNKAPHAILSARFLVTFIATAVPFFFLGTLSSLYSGVVHCSTDNHASAQQTTGLRQQQEGASSQAQTEADISARVAEKVRSLQMEMQADQTATVDRVVEERMAVLMRQHNVNCYTPKDKGTASEESEAEMNIKVNQLVETRLRALNCVGSGGNGKESTSESNLFPVDKVGHFVSGMARTTKDDFTSQLDLGVPLDKVINGSSSVLLIYNNQKSLPKAIKNNIGGGSDMIPDLSMADAMENCDYLNVLLTHHTFGREQCIAIVPQYESYHLQKWMRIDNGGALDKTYPLQKVSRGHQSNGRDQFNPPSIQDTHKQWDMLRKYLDSIHDVLEDLRPIVEKIAVQNTIIVMVCNFGQSELLMNFVCSAKARGFDISNILVFATDQETLDLAHSIGLAAYFDERVRTPSCDLM
jgi:hypothetical protein